MTSHIEDIWIRAEYKVVAVDSVRAGSNHKHRKSVSDHVFIIITFYFTTRLFKLLVRLGRDSKNKLHMADCLHFQLEFN